MNLGTGRTTVATAGTAVRLTSGTLTTPTSSLNYVDITAETDNTGTIVVGDSAVVAAVGTRRGTPLSAGQTMTVYTDGLDDIWLDTTVNGDGVTFTYVEGN
jgi:hypothetical protein